MGIKGVLKLPAALGAGNGQTSQVFSGVSAFHHYGPADVFGLFALAVGQNHDIDKRKTPQQRLAPFPGSVKKNHL